MRVLILIETEAAVASGRLLIRLMTGLLLRWFMVLIEAEVAAASRWLLVAAARFLPTPRKAVCVTVYRVAFALTDEDRITCEVKRASRRCGREHMKFR